MEAKHATAKSNPLQINVTSRAINGVNGVVDLTPREYGLLSCLVDHAGSPMSRTDLLRDAWGWDYASELKTKTVDMHVRRLRVKFERAGLDPSAISTVRGRGYVYIAS